MSKPTGELGWVPKVLLRHLTTSVVVCQKYIVGPQFFTLFESSLKWTVLGRRERSFDIWLNNQNIESAGSWIELKRHFLNLISLLKYFWPSTLKSLDRPFIGDQSLLSDYPVDLTWPSVSTIAAKVSLIFVNGLSIQFWMTRTRKDVLIITCDVIWLSGSNFKISCSLWGRLSLKKVLSHYFYITYRCWIVQMVKYFCLNFGSVYRCQMSIVSNAFWLSCIKSTLKIMIFSVHRRSCTWLLPDKQRYSIYLISTQNTLL